MLLDLEYISRISVELKKFKKKTDGSFNFRCPICGDSKKDENKARAWFYKSNKHNKMTFKCYNCGAAMLFQSFLKSNFHNHYKEYLLDKFKATRTTPVRETTYKKNKKMDQFKKSYSIQKLESKESYYSSIKSIESLSSDHPAKAYLINRLIPREALKDLYWTDHFKAFTNSLVPGKFKEPIEVEEGRILIPLRDEFGIDFGFQGRSIDPDNTIRYMTIIVKDVGTKAYGLDKVNINKPILVVEGPFDSMLIENSIAACGSDLSNVVGDAYMLDNEPRNKHIVKKYEKLVLENKKIVLFPEKYQGLDVNDLILKGITPKQVQDLIMNNMYSGTRAILALKKWRKC